MCLCGVQVYGVAHLQATCRLRVESTRKPPDQAVSGCAIGCASGASTRTHSSCSRSQRAQCHGR